MIYRRKRWFEILRWPYVTFYDLWGHTSFYEKFAMLAFIEKKNWFRNECAREKG